MKSTLNNTILYAKNWYRHSDNIVKDLKKIIHLDDPDADVSSEQKIWEWLRHESLKFMKEHPELQTWSIDGKVAWSDDGPVAGIWSLIIGLGVYIPMTSKYLDSPVYDFNRGIFPQYQIRNGIFKKSYSDVECIKAAKEYLEKSNADRLDILANEMLDKLDFEEISKRFSLIGEEVTPESLDDEFWDAYSDTVNSHIKNGNIEDFRDPVITKHFLIDITNKGTDISIQVHNLLHETTVDSKRIYDSFCERTDISKLENIAKTLNENGYDIDSSHLTEDEIKDTIKEHHKDCIEKGYSDIQFGYFRTILNHETKEGKILFIDFFTCTCYNNEFYNFSGWVSGEKN